MKTIRFKNIDFIPASHEDPKSPAVLKKVLLEKKDFIKGSIQMINWAKLLSGKSFQAHYHEDMEEIFIIIKGKALMKIGNDKDILAEGDVAIVPIKKVHTMENKGKKAVEYIVIGISQEKGGKTIKI